MTMITMNGDSGHDMVIAMTNVILVVVMTMTTVIMVVVMMVTILTTKSIIVKCKKYMFF